MCVHVCCVAVATVCLLLFLLFALSFVCLFFVVVVGFFCFVFLFPFLFSIFYQAALCSLWALGSRTRGQAWASGVGTESRILEHQRIPGPRKY